MKKKIDVSTLSTLQRKVTLEAGTEPPFQNEYWNEFQTGLYVDILDGTPLFTSIDKFDSGCGWPSFTKPITQDSLVERKDYSHGMIRQEVKAKDSNIHLGHVFNDGPLEDGGLRYCMNSASLRFIKVEDLEKEGYKEYLKLFKR